MSDQNPRLHELHLPPYPTFMGEPRQLGVEHQDDDEVRRLLENVIDHIAGIADLDPKISLMAYWRQDHG